MAYSYDQLIRVRQQSANEDEQARRAVERSIFLAQDNYSIERILETEMLKFMSRKRLNKTQLVSMDGFVKSFLDKLCLVHKQPAIIKVDPSADAKQKQLFYKLLEEVEFYKTAIDSDIKMRLHNTILSAVRYYPKLDRIYIDNSFNAGTTKVVGFEGFEDEARFVIRYRINKYEKDEWVVWDSLNKWNYRCIDEPKYDADVEDIISAKYEIDADIPFEYQESYWPFTKYQYSDDNYGFFGCGFDTLVTTNKITIILMTILV